MRNRIGKRSAAARFREFAQAHRAFLEASVAAFDRCGDRNGALPAHVVLAWDDAFDAIPVCLRWLVLPVERHVARQLRYRDRTS